LEVLDELARMDRRVDELERLITGPSMRTRHPVWPTAPWSRSASRRRGGDVPDRGDPRAGFGRHQDDVVTASSPLGQALVGRRTRIRSATRCGCQKVGARHATW
jgi:hypothetical protein